jgi:hypothetical protein
MIKIWNFSVIFAIFESFYPEPVLLIAVKQSILAHIAFLENK